MASWSLMKTPAEGISYQSLINRSAVFLLLLVCWWQFDCAKNDECNLWLVEERHMSVIIHGFGHDLRCLSLSAVAGIRPQRSQRVWIGRLLLTAVWMEWTLPQGQPEGHEARDRHDPRDLPRQPRADPRLPQVRPSAHTHIYLAFCHTCQWPVT